MVVLVVEALDFVFFATFADASSIFLKSLFIAPMERPIAATAAAAPATPATTETPPVANAVATAAAAPAARSALKIVTSFPTAVTNAITLAATKAPAINVAITLRGLRMSYNFFKMLEIILKKSLTKGMMKVNAVAVISPNLAMPSVSFLI